MSGTFVVLWVDPNPREWGSSQGGQFIDYAIKCKEPDGAERSSVITRKVGGRAGPEVGQSIFGHIEESRVEPKPGQNFQAFTKRKLKEDSQGAPQNASGGSSRDDAPDSAFWAQKDRRLARAGITQAIVTASEPPLGDDPSSIATYVKDVEQLADALLTSLDRRTPSPNHDGPNLTLVEGSGLGGGEGPQEPVRTPAAESSASPARKGATSRRLREAGIADPDTQRAIVAAFAGNPVSVAGLDAVDAAVANRDWHVIFDEQGIPRPPEFPDTAGLPPLEVA